MSVARSVEAGFSPLDKELQVPDGHLLPHAQQTLEVGQRVLEIQNEQAQPLAACPEEKASERMAMSSDGAMVPLVGGVWAEVKVVAIGAVERRRRKDEEQIVTTKLTYFARLANAATFADQASAEVRRRGIERAKQVCAIQDGAEWIQGGCRKAIATTRCAFSTLPMQLATSVRSRRRCARVEGTCPPSGWMASCTGSNTKGQRECCATSTV